MIKWKHLSIGLIGAIATLAAGPASAVTYGGSDYQVTANAGLGYDTNVYETNSSAYNDLYQVKIGNTANSQITPNVQSGLFVPLDLAVKTEKGNRQNTYAFKANYYLGSALKNATTYDLDVNIDWNKELGSDQGELLLGSEIYYGVYAGVHRQTYYDHDTGLPKQTSKAANISNRYNYVNFGGEAGLKQTLYDIEIKLDGKLEQRQYNDPVAVSALDHMLIKLGGSARTPILSNDTKVKVSYDFTSRIYSTRPALNAQGSALASNGSLTYTYHSFGAQLFHRLKKNVFIFLDIDRTNRYDNFVSYGDYIDNSFKVRSLYRFSPVMAMKARVAYSSKKYPNGFAFDNPASGVKKYYKTLKATLEGEYETFMADIGDPTVWGRIEYTKQDTNDLRYLYNKSVVTVGGDWKF